MASVVSCAGRNSMTKIILRKFKPSCCRWMSSGDSGQKALSEGADGKVKYEYVPDFTKPLDGKNWVSYGFDYKDPDQDKYKMHSAFFAMIFVIVTYGFVFMYGPDPGHLHWAKREAYIRLHEREKLGLDPVDKNYVDPDKMVLPSDEELGDFEIII